MILAQQYMPAWQVPQCGKVLHLGHSRTYENLAAKESNASQQTSFAVIYSRRDMAAGSPPKAQVVQWARHAGLGLGSDEAWSCSITGKQEGYHMVDRDAQP